MKKNGYLFFKFALPITALFLIGCNPSKSSLNEFNTYYRASNFDQATLFLEAKISKSGNPSNNDLLWELHLASIKFLVDDHNKSVQYFDRSEEMLNYFDYQNEVTAAVASTMVNDNVVSYLGKEYDGVMVNTYKAVNFMILGKNDLARIEFNRALDRQSRAKEHFAKEILKAKEKMAQEEQKRKININGNLENPKVQELIAQKYPSLNEYKAYPDFVNPFTTYLAGIYFNLVHDPAKAVDLLKESHGMLPDNPYISEDLIAVENQLDGKAVIENLVWVIFENGLGPVKEEFRIDLPLFIVTNKVQYVGIALPMIKSREQAYADLIVNAADKQYHTQVVADVDSIVRAEFAKEFQGILIRAITSATVKAAAQYALQQQNSQGGSWAAIAMAIYSFATTAADVRIWTTLPKDFQVARLNIPQDRKITISSPQGLKILDVNIPDCNNAIVYVKIPFREATPSCDVIAFKN